MIKQFSAAILLTALSTNLLAASGKMDDKQKLSYLLGQNTGQSMLSKDIKIDAKAFLKGLKDALNNKSSALTAAESNEVMMKFQQDMRAKAQAKQEKESSTNIKAGKKFITQYKKGADVLNLDNGISYKIIKKGNGISPAVSDTVVAHYTGKLIDGQVFDSSVQRGQPSTFPLANVIKGWQEVLPKMKIGSKWEVVIPPQLAYGERSPGGLIGANATLVFEIELIEVKKN